jgi:Tol biopolymer transport system component/tRNA A-37 threonylcarbamoyl transferase component Bud32
VTPTRWGRIKQLFTAARERPAGERALFLETACDGDASVRAEVEKLLASDSASLVSPLWRRQYRAGDTLEHYRIECKLGEGGMGVVYKARDTRLDRSVALKLSTTPFSGRFEREARAVAALNHPHICTLYDVGPDYLAMEYVEGKPPAGPLPLDEALRLAGQLLDALEAAHRQGIVHRDLKPANILVTKAGVKVLDFGLAKMERAVTAEAETVTEAGTILGTLHYMSPEQVQGKDVDARSDLFSFGLVLYEMLTGKRAFEAEDPASVMAAILEREPAELEGIVPAGVQRILRRCLAKDPADRWSSAGDVKAALEWSGETALPTPARLRWLSWSIAGLGMALAAAAVGVLAMRPSVSPGPGAVRFTVPLPAGTEWPENAQATEWVPSPDGSNLAMVVGEGVKSALWVRPLAAGAAHRLDQTEGADLPFWSPDGQSIAYFVGNALRRIAIAGGSPTTICDLPAYNTPDGGTWNQQDVIVFATTAEKPLYRVSASGGVPAPATTLEKGETGQHWPQFLPDGRHVLYLASGSDDTDAIYIQELGSPKRVRVVKSTMRAMWSPPGFLLFTHEGNLFAQHVHPGTFQLEGYPLPLAEGVLANSGRGRESTFAASGNGVLVYRASKTDTRRRIAWRDRAGRVLRQIGDPVQYAADIQLSPDEKSGAILVWDGKSVDLWTMDLASGVTIPLTHDGKVRTTPRWSPDSKRLAVPRTDGSLEQIDAASGEITLLAKGAGIAEDWLPDGRSILCKEGEQLSLLSLSGDHRLQPLIAYPFPTGSVRLSRDGRYVAYTSRETGTQEVFVATFPSFSVKRRISASGGASPTWTKDGRVVLYETPDGTVTEAEIRVAPDLAVGERRPLFKLTNPYPILHGPNGHVFGAAADGQRFLTAEPASGPEKLELTVIVNWPAHLKR